MATLTRFAADHLNVDRVQVDRLQRQLERLVFTYPATAILVSTSVITFFLIQVNYLVQLLSWIFYYLEIIGRFLFSWTYPAAVFSFGVVFFLRLFPKGFMRRLGNYRAESRPLVIFTTVMFGIIAGQLTLLCLPPLVNLMALPFVSDPTSLLTIIALLGALFYGVYYSFIVDAPEARVRGQPEEMDDRGDENVCAVCLVNPKTILMKPCRHFSVCTECIRQLVECPVCKSNILDYERIYPT